MFELYRHAVEALSETQVVCFDTDYLYLTN